MDTPEKPKRGRPRLPESERKTHVTMFMHPKLVELVKRLGAERGIGFGPLVSQALSEHFAKEFEQANRAQEHNPASIGLFDLKSES